MPKSIYVQFLSERPNASIHYLNRLVKLLIHFISIEPSKKPKGFEDHHIVPKAKSWKPEWDKIPENHLKVPAKAHHVIHHLMYKAFPEDYAMIEAFHLMVNGQQKQKITAKVYEGLRIVFSKTQSIIHKQREANETHHLLGGEIQRKCVNDGTHNFLGGNLQRKRVLNGTHPFLNLSKERVNNGTHHWLRRKNSKRIYSKKIC